MQTENLIRVVISDRPEYREKVSQISEAVWPEFMFHDEAADRYWDGLYDTFASYQFGFVDPENLAMVGFINSVPLAWDGDPLDLPDAGWDWALIQSYHDHSAGLSLHTLCGIQISINPAYQGQGLSRFMVQALKDSAVEAGLRSLVVPVRPNFKPLYPLASIDQYIRWQNDQDLPFDPWLRVHVRSGGQIIQPCRKAMRITGSIAEWETWTGLRFFESGPHIIHGALNPVDFDLEQDLGVYIEPNVWVNHPLG